MTTLFFANQVPHLYDSGTGNKGRHGFTFPNFPHTVFVFSRLTTISTEQLFLFYCFSY